MCGDPREKLKQKTAENEALKEDGTTPKTPREDVLEENKQLRDALDEAKIMRKALEQVSALAFHDQWRSKAMEELKRKFEELWKLAGDVSVAQEFKKKLQEKGVDVSNSPACVGYELEESI